MTAFPSSTSPWPSLIILFGLFAICSCSPLPDASPAARDNGGEGANGHGSATCWQYHDTGEYKITLHHWTYDEWGRGLLDNLRGQCGWIHDWTFENDTARFSVDSCGPNKVEDAIFLASYNHLIGVFCLAYDW